MNNKSSPYSSFCFLCFSFLFRATPAGRLSACSLFLFLALSALALANLVFLCILSDCLVRLSLLTGKAWIFCYDVKKGTIYERGKDMHLKEVVSKLYFSHSIGNTANQNAVGSIPDYCSFRFCRFAMLIIFHSFLFLPSIHSFIYQLQ